MAYVLGKKSREKMQGLHPDLVRVLELAIKKTTQDFAVIEGVRTLARQKALVKSGASQTMASKHLRQYDGFSHAFDVVPYGDFDGNGTSELSWHWGHFYPVVEAIRAAAKELGVRVRWGGAWVVLNDTAAPTRDLVAAYTARKVQQGKPAFTDGPHFELVK